MLLHTKTSDEMDILADQIIERAFCIKHSGIILIATYAGITILIMFEIDFRKALI